MRNAITDDSIGFELSKPQSRTVRGTYITDLDYCDDIALLSSTWMGAQKLLLSVEEWSKKVGLNYNIAKTEYMLIGNWDEERSQNLIRRVSNNNSINEVKDFKYLGS